MKPKPTFERSAPGTWKSWKRSCELYPVGMPKAMKLAYSVSVPLPRMMAPARRSLRAMKASFFGSDPPRATEMIVRHHALIRIAESREVTVRARHLCAEMRGVEQRVQFVTEARRAGRA